ncbi:recombinase family protein [Elizabethkingia anophelis]|nr:recombinase family protein [Elizabethkingia anophelis]MDV3776008.1 recombinase family protein [Elizabethkingia anophelis]MDV3840151.1 recombinase family protein [Elizabethkingia anophelis]
MKKADLYIRVSTDEQADKGYSQRDQEERLRRFCFTNKITVGQVIYEDHSAKTFNRPEWIKLLNNLKKRSLKTDLVLFTKWDRFSRNAGDAYQMINTLNKLGIEPQAVEQPLDLSIPENKMMLAIYLAAPEVENDRRALNTFYGMRRARKEGRLMGKAPFGYINRSKEDGRKYVALKDPEALAMQWAFNEIAKGILAADQVRQKMNAQSQTTLSRSAFHVAIRNPLYYGKIFIAKFQDEEAHLVQGQHEPLISKELFNKVQLILGGNKRAECPNTKILSDENLPLRGFLVCPECHRNLTGSASKGRKNRYYYYHCLSSCGFRQRAEIANDIFEKGIRQFELNDGIKSILKKLLLDNYKKFIQNPIDKKKKIAQEIDNLNVKLSIARNKLLSETIDDEEYLEIKKECRDRIEHLEEQLSKDSTDTKNIDIEKSLERALHSIVNIPKLYSEGAIHTRRAIIGSIFPEKLVFDEKTYRTTRMNVIANYIFQINNELLQNKNRANENIFHLSCLVAPPGIEPESKV